MTWNNKRDTLIYDFSDLIKEAKMLTPTKRNVLKILSSFYNPMSLIPLIILGLKILMQYICKKSYNDGYNILRLFDTLPNFLFNATEVKRDY